MEFFEIAGNEFYFDLEEISDFVRINEEEPKKLEELFDTSEKKENNELIESQGPLIDMTRWDLLKVMIETILSENGVVDEGMGSTMLGKQLSIPCRLSFNTLIKHKLIKKN
tara:strand:- start:826 stop:1158 length:333 start_codon:yes stop_codon:yes gene_type:complete